MIALHTVAFVLLLWPAIWELVNDKRGEDRAEKKKDLPKRLLWMAVVAGANAIILSGGLLQLLKAMAMTIALFFFIFDYAINAILLHNKVIAGKDVFSYLSSSPLDNLWRGWNPWLRFAVRLIVLIAATIIYF